MNILLTGANGYIGQRLLPLLVEQGHHVVALVRSSRRLQIPPHCRKQVTIIVGDLLKPTEVTSLPKEVDAAYYLVHSMTQKQDELLELEAKAAQNFLKLLEGTNAKQIIYLSGLANDENLSPHLRSRLEVENVLRSGLIPVTTLRAAIIVGSGSASFEIMRDLVEKLPIMIAPRWVENRCQPIGIFDALEYLVQVLGHPECLGKSFDIGGPDILTYREMLQTLAKIRGLRRWIIGIPILTPRLSSYWLHFVTSINISLARTLIDSLKNEAVCHDSEIDQILKKRCFSFERAIRRTFAKIEENAVISSWKDAISTTDLSPNLLEYVKVPTYGCLTDTQEVPFECSQEQVLDALWAIGGSRGWYYMNWAWVARGIIDQFVLGSGLRRGRTHPTRLRAGDALDFWRVLLADRDHKRLLLYAEMKLPGEAWLEFSVEPQSNGALLKQKATFRPNGLLGRLYWYGIYPFHWFIFHGMARAIVRYAEKQS